MKPAITTAEVEALKRRLSALHAEGRETQLESDLERALTIAHRELISECRARIAGFMEGIARGRSGAPAYLPPDGSDLYAVAVWMCGQEWADAVYPADQPWLRSTGDD